MLLEADAVTGKMLSSGCAVTGELTFSSVNLTG